MTIHRTKSISECPEVLPAKQTRYPLLSEHEPKWFAVRSKFNCELRLQEQLNKLGIEAYSPLQKRAVVRGKKVIFRLTPLISCYTFVKIVRDQLLPVLENPYCLGTVLTTGQLIPIPDDSIHFLKRICAEEGLELVARAAQFTKGDRVQIIEGNLVGLQGVIERRQGKRQLVIHLEKVGYDLLITVDESLLAAAYE